MGFVGVAELGAVEVGAEVDVELVVAAAGMIHFLQYCSSNSVSYRTVHQLCLYIECVNLCICNVIICVHIFQIPTCLRQDMDMSVKIWKFNQYNKHMCAHMRTYAHTVCPHAFVFLHVYTYTVLIPYTGHTMARNTRIQ